MHLPDGFLDLKTCITTYAISGLTLGYSLKKLKNNFQEKDIPLLGLLGAFIFAAQMINLPVAAGTSGHLMGGVLAMLVVGPGAASIIITSILIIQAFFFMDGGIAVLGANILNMAIIQVYGGYLIYRIFKKIIPVKVSIFMTALLATILSAGFAGLELSFSGTIPANIVLPAILGWHFLIGLIEGIITLLITGYLQKMIPERRGLYV